MTPKQKTEVLEILDKAQDTTVATVREDGYPQATTVSFVHDGMRIYFGCDPQSQKARNIQRSDKISLTVNLPYKDWSEIRGISIGGRAHFVKDKTEQRRVIENMMTRFPQIKDFIEASDAEDVSIVCVEPEVISLLDYRKGFGHTEEVSVDS